MHCPIPKVSLYALRTDKMRIKLVRLMSLQLPGPSGLRQPAE